jgi:hypothetical protein
MPAIQPVTMSVDCSQCGTALALIVSDWTPDIYAERSKQDYVCPMCDKPQTATLSGHIVQVTRRVVSGQLTRGSRARVRSHRPDARTTG